MGNLVTLTIHNDHLGDIERNPKRFVQELAVVASGKTTSRVIFAQTKVQGYKHISVPAIYLQMGGTCLIMDPHDSETQHWMRSNRGIFEERLLYLEQIASELRKLYDSSKSK